MNASKNSNPSQSDTTTHAGENRWETKDSGERVNFSSGMVRDVEDAKVDYLRIYDGPMADRWAELLSRGAVKYPDLPGGCPNWMLAKGREEYTRFRRSAARHFRQWVRGDQDEDHAAAVFFNLNGAEYVKHRLKSLPAEKILVD